MATIGVIIIAVLLALIVIVIFGAVLSASVLVTIAVRREERLMSLNDRAPGKIAALARMLLGVAAPRKADELFPRRAPTAKPAWYERTAGMR